MTSDPDRLPRIGASARELGVRVPKDIAPDANGFVEPRSGGMSTACASLWNLPHHRRPRRLGHGSTGRDEDHVFMIDEGLISEPLVPRADPRAPDLHTFVEPAQRMSLTEYVSCLQRTRSLWQAGEP